MPITEPGQARTRLIEHRGVQIMLLDYSDILHPAEALAAIAESKQVIARQPAGSVRTLTYVEGARYSTPVIDALKDLTTHNKPFVRAGAVVGMNTLQRIVFRAVTAFSRRNIHVFEELEDAKDWLAQQ